MIYYPMFLKHKLRDYHDDLRPLVEFRDPMISLEATSMWTENLPTASQQADPALMSQADGKIDALQKNQQKLAFEADCLALARDASQLANLYREEQQSERSNRLAKVCHLKTENGIGSNLVAQHMLKVCRHATGTKNEIIAEVDKALTDL